MPPERKKLKKSIRIKKPHFQYTEEALAKAVHAIRIENKGIRETCRHFGVPRTTVQDRLSGKVMEQPRKVGPEPLIGLDGEKIVVDWIMELAKCGIPVSKELLLETVTKLIKDTGIEDKFPEGRPGRTWYQGFLRRHPEISLREPEGINKAREAVKENLNKKGMADIMKDPNEILNGDETAVSLCQKSVSECKKRWESLRDQYNKKTKEGSARMSFLSDAPERRVSTITVCSEEMTENDSQTIPNNVNTGIDFECENIQEINAENIDNTDDACLGPSTSKNQNPTRLQETRDKRDRLRLNLLESLVENTRNQSQIRPQSAIKKFFESMAEVVETFPSPEQAMIRAKVCQLVSDTEIKLSSVLMTHTPKKSWRK